VAVTHTPGPWEARRLEADGHILTREGWEIRTPVWDVATWRAQGAPIRKKEDAFLIAAAPDLLAACEATVDAMIRYRDGGEDGDFWNEATAMGRAAIAKVKGEQ